MLIQDLAVRPTSRVRKHARSAIAAVALGTLLLLTRSVDADAQAFGRECVEFGTPSFTATRELDTGRGKVVSKFYSSEGRQREETVAGDGKSVRIMRDGALIMFDTVRKTGVSLPEHPPELSGAPKLADNERRIIRERHGDVTRMITQRKRGAEWVIVLVVDCRADGVLVGATFPAPGPDGQLIYQSFRHFDIVVGPIDDALFDVPADVTITTHPPGPPLGTVPRKQ